MARTLCIPPNSVNWTIWIITVVPAPLAVLCIIIGFIQTSKVKTTNLKIAYIFALFCLFCCQIAVSSQPFLAFEFSGFCTDFTQIIISSQMTNNFINLSFIATDIVYGLRLFMFKKAANIESKLQQFIFIFVLLIEICAVFFQVNFSRLYWKAFFDDISAVSKREPYLDAVFLCFHVLVIAHLFNNLLLLFLFITDIKRLCENAQDTVTTEDDIRKIIHLPSRYALCLIVAFSATFVLFTYVVYRTVFAEGTNAIYLLTFTFESWHAFFNLLSIVFQFDSWPFGVMFNKCCTGGMRCMERYFLKRVLRSRERKNKDIDPIEDHIRHNEAKGERDRLVLPQSATTKKTKENAEPQVTLTQMTSFNTDATTALTALTTDTSV